MQPRFLLFAVSVLFGGLLGFAWNWPGFKSAYEGFIAAFVNPNAPLIASTVVLLAFVSGVSRICVP